MCGIAGEVTDGPDAGSRARVQMMNDLQAHRGPDGDGVVTFENVTFGHRRLAILDLSAAGNQPMASADQRFLIIHNGEIYNYLELRGQLRQLGCQFRSDTDTEVVLHAYAQWGENCLERFNGMWAFAILDRVKRTVFLSRDRLGIKPFYYHHEGRRLLFASEVKAIAGACAQLREPSWRYIQHFLPGGSFDDGCETFFERIVALPAGSHATMDMRTGELVRGTYWQPRQGDPTVVVDRDPVAQLRELLENSVSLRLRSDVPVGTCLSGGVDSSTLVGIAATKTTKPIHTFSGVYPDKDCDERPYIDLVNEHCGTIPGLITPEPAGRLLDILRTITWHQDAPTAGPGLYTQYFVMQRAQHDVKVLLDGQGGDELFAGYLPYFGSRIADLLNSNQIGQRAAGYKLAAALAVRWGPNWLTTIPHGPRTRLLSGSARGMRWLRRKVFQGGTEPALFTDGFVAQHARNAICRSYPDTPSQSALSNQLYWDTLSRSIPGLLHYEDRNSMAFSIEARVPLLDHRIVEFAFALQDHHKIRGDWSKWILREAAKDLLPAEVSWRRSKLGYPTPFARWIRQKEDSEHMYELLFSPSFVKRSIVPEKTVQFYWDQHMSGVRDHGWMLYRLAALELWFQDFIDDLRPNPATPP